MALSFRPPEELINAYLQRPSPGQEASAGIQQAMQTYMQMKALEQQQGLKNQEIKLASAKNAREDREALYNYGDIAGLSPADQSAVLNPVQGPATAEGIPPQLPPSIQRYKDFLSKNPQGIKGREDQSKGEIPLFNEQGKPIKAQTPTGLLPPNAKVIDDTQGRGAQFVGWQDNRGLVFDPNNVSLSQIASPGTGPVAPKVAPSVPSEAIEKGAAQQGFLGLLDKIEAGYKPEFVGPIQSRIRKASQRYDIPGIGLGATTEAANFERDLADLRSAIVNERTGAAVGERQEWDRLLELIPDDAKSDKDFLPKVQSIRRRYQQILANRTAGFAGAGYRMPGANGPTGGDPLGIR